MAYVGLCGTDLHILHGDMDSRVHRPLTFGHEVSGWIDSVGPDVTGWPAGDAVTTRGPSLVRRQGIIRSNNGIDVIEVDLTGQFVLARAVGASMLDRGRGKVIFIASLLSFQGGVNIPGYTAARSGVAGLTKALANEWAHQGR